MRVDSAGDVDAAFAELSEKGVAFVSPLPSTTGIATAAISSAQITNSGKSTPGAALKAPLAKENN